MPSQASYERHLEKNKKHSTSLLNAWWRATWTAKLAITKSTAGVIWAWMRKKGPALRGSKWATAACGQRHEMKIMGTAGRGWEKASRRANTTYWPGLCVSSSTYSFQQEGGGEKKKRDNVSLSHLTGKDTTWQRKRETSLLTQKKEECSKRAAEDMAPGDPVTCASWPCKALYCSIYRVVSGCWKKKIVIDLWYTCVFPSECLAIQPFKFNLNESWQKKSFSFGIQKFIVLFLLLTVKGSDGEKKCAFTKLSRNHELII